MRNILVGASALILVMGIAGAQAASRKHQPANTQHSAASLACSQQANEKGLHGKARKKFREACKRQYTRGNGYAPKQSNDYQPQQGQAYKPTQDKGFNPQQGRGNPQQGQGGKQMKWW
jgi:type II secretory pathway pseudopilin PulG